LADRPLLERVLNGDRDALEEICQATWRGLYSFVYWRVQNREDAEDITQETYARLLRAAPRLETRDGALLGLLRTIALNLARDGWRRREVRGPAVPLEQAKHLPHSPGDDEVARSAQRLTVRAALDRLPDEQRAVVQLRLLDGFSIRETARITRKTEAAVRSLQYRGLQKLGDLLDDERATARHHSAQDGGAGHAR